LSHRKVDVVLIRSKTAFSRLHFGMEAQHELVREIGTTSVRRVPASQDGIAATSSTARRALDKEYGSAA
jgi:hypothetical protein